MKHLKTFESLSGDILEKIKSLDNPGFYESLELSPIKEGDALKIFDTFNLIEDDIKKLYNLAYFQHLRNAYNMDLFRIYPSNFNFWISIAEKDDEYFLVNVVGDGGIHHAKFLCDQTTGLMSLLTDIHQIIYI